MATRRVRPHRLPAGRYPDGPRGVPRRSSACIARIDTGHLADKQTKLQVNGAAGFTFNFENTETDKSGNEFISSGRWVSECTPGLVLGVVGYDYRQLTGDSAGARLGPFEGSVDAIGPGLSYTTVIRQTPFVFNLRHYQEFNAENR